MARKLFVSMFLVLMVSTLIPWGVLFSQVFGKDTSAYRTNEQTKESSLKVNAGKQFRDYSLFFPAIFRAMALYADSLLVLLCLLQRSIGIKRAICLRTSNEVLELQICIHRFLIFFVRPVSATTKPAASMRNA